MIGNGNRGCSLIDGAAGIVCGENAFDHDGATPKFADPLEIGPGHGGSGERGGNVVASGTPEQLLRFKKSYTAQALEKVLRPGKVA